MGSLLEDGSPPFSSITYRQDVTAKAICLSLCLFCRVSDLDCGVKVVLTSSMGAALFGYDLGVIAYVIEAPDFLRTVGMETEVDENYMGFIVSSLLLG